MENELPLQDPSSPKLVSADENFNVAMISTAGLSNNGNENEAGDEEHDGESVNKNTQNNNDGTESSSTSQEQSEHELNENTEIVKCTAQSDVVVDIDDSASECSYDENKGAILDSETGEEANDEETSCPEYNDFSAAYGEAKADGCGFSDGENLLKSYVMPYKDTCDPCLADIGTNVTLDTDNLDAVPFKINEAEREEGCGQESDGMVHLDDLVVQSLAGSVTMQGINGIFYDNEPTDCEALSDVLEGDLGLEESDHTYSKIPLFSSRGIYSNDDELLGFSTTSAGESPAACPELTEPVDVSEPLMPVLKAGSESDESEGKPLYSSDPLNVVCDQLSDMQLKESETVTSITETGTLNDSVNSQNEDACLMQQLHDALEDDRMLDMKAMLDKLEPDIKSDETSWMRLHDMLEKHHQDQLMYQCQQHDRRVNQIKNQINSEIHIQQDSLQRRLATHQRALGTDIVAPKRSYESPTRHSTIGQLSPSKLATPTLDKYEAKISPSHNLIDLNNIETREREGPYGTDNVAAYPTEDEDHEAYKQKELKKQKKDLLSRFDLETPVMKALSFPLYSQYNVKDSGYQSPRTRSIFKKTGTRLSDASDFVSPPLMYSKRTSLEGERSKSSQGFYEPALADMSKPWGANQEHHVYHATFLDDIRDNGDEFYDLPEKIQLILDRKKKLTESSPTGAIVKEESFDERLLDEKDAFSSSPRDATQEESALNTTFTITESGDESAPTSPRRETTKQIPSKSHLDIYDPVIALQDNHDTFDSFLPERFLTNSSHNEQTPPKHGGREAQAEHSPSAFQILKESHSPAIADCSLREELEGGEEAVAETSHLSALRMDGMDLYESLAQDARDDVSVSTSVRMCRFLQDCCDVLENKVDSSQRDNHDKQRQLWEYEHKVDTLERKFNLSEIQRRTLESLVEKLNQHIKDKDSEIHALGNENRRLTNSLDVSQRVFDDYEQISREKRAIQTQLTNADSALFTAQSEMSGLVRQISRLELENKRLTREFDITRRSSLSTGSSSRIFGSLYETNGPHSVPSISLPPPPADVLTSSNVGDTERYYRSVLGGSFHSDASQRSPSPLIQADQQLQRLKLATEIHQASRLNSRDTDRHDASNSLLGVPKSDDQGTTPTNNMSPPTKDASVINAPHVKPKRRMSMGKSPRRSLGAEFETSNLLAHSHILREKYEHALKEMGRENNELDNSIHSEDSASDLDETLTKVKSGVYCSMPEYERPSSRSARQGTKSGLQARDGDRAGRQDSAISRESQSTTRSLFSSSIDETVQNITNLERRFDYLQMEKRKMESALSHVGSRGPKAMSEREHLESELDKMDKELASIRMHLKKYNVL